MAESVWYSPSLDFLGIFDSDSGSFVFAGYECEENGELFCAMHPGTDTQLLVMGWDFIGEFT